MIDLYAWPVHSDSAGLARRRGGGRLAALFGTTIAYSCWRSLFATRTKTLLPSAPQRQEGMQCEACAPSDEHPLYPIRLARIEIKGREQPITTAKMTAWRIRLWRATSEGGVKGGREGTGTVIGISLERVALRDQTPRMCGILSQVQAVGLIYVNRGWRRLASGSRLQAHSPCTGRRQRCRRWTEAGSRTTPTHLSVLS